MCLNIRLYINGGSVISNFTEKKWILPEPVDTSLLSSLEIPNSVKAILIRRGYKNPQSVLSYINPKPPPNPYQDFPGLSVAVNRLKIACINSEPIAICGDYDADGMTSSALLFKALEQLGAKPKVSIPNRMTDGYGLNISMINQLNKEGIKLIVTVDNGVSAIEAINQAKKLSMNVIITDHHAYDSEPQNILALIHPLTTPENSTYRCLAGVGLAYVLSLALAKEMNNLKATELSRDFFCLGTIADMAPLSGANRSYMKEGLTHLNHTKSTGLKSLMKLAGLGEEELTSRDIGFQLAPRINSVGRLGDPNTIVELLLEDDEAVAFALARKCDQLNRLRKELCNSIEIEALALIEAENMEKCSFIMLAQSHWHHGVIGIVATRIVEKYNRPTALLAGDGDGILRASVRAPKGFNVVKALSKCSDNLLRYGGHTAAGGFSLKAEDLSLVHSELVKQGDIWLNSSSGLIEIRPDSYINLKDINIELMDSLKLLEPFGIENELPIFWTRGCNVNKKVVLNGGHLKLNLVQEDAMHQAIMWKYDRIDEIPPVIDIAFHVVLNRWNGKEDLQLELVSIRQHNSEVVLNRNNNYYIIKRENDNEISMKNSNGEKIKWSLSLDGNTSSMDDKAKHPYIKNLLKEALTCLGINP